MIAASGRSELEITASADGERQAAMWLERECEARGVPPDQAYRIDTCLSETLANVFVHGGTTEPVRIFLECHLDGRQPRVVLSISDRGREFNPLAETIKPRPMSLDEAEPGGLGLVMIRKFSDEQHYAYSDAQNHLTLVFRWKSPE
jgi:anti-sigma regulatory factor (Ser/Thr protein kinase)